MKSWPLGKSAAFGHYIIDIWTGKHMKKLYCNRCEKELPCYHSNESLRCALPNGRSVKLKPYRTDDADLCWPCLVALITDVLLSKLENELPKAKRLHPILECTEEEEC